MQIVPIVKLKRVTLVVGFAFLPNFWDGAGTSDNILLVYQ